MKNSNFMKRFVNLLLIVVVLAGYQCAMIIWDKEEANVSLTAKLSEVEAQSATTEAADEESVAGIYTDGTYTGTGTGFGGTIEVSVTVENGSITNVEVLSAEKEDSAYLTMAMDVVDEILEEQSADVDTISGATYSSTGIKEAVKNALEQAVA